MLLTYLITDHNIGPIGHHFDLMLATDKDRELPKSVVLILWKQSSQYLVSVWTKLVDRSTEIIEIGKILPKGTASR